jgi:phosphoribosyl-AMP cyclohydrolase
MGEMVVDFDKQGGIVPVIVQDHQTGEVLMLAYMNREAFDQTRATGRMHYFSRSRNRQWMKGETSGHVQEVVEARVDCDNDTLLFKVRQIGDAACHTGYRSCFHRQLERDGRLVVTESHKVFDPDKVYAP